MPSSKATLCFVSDFEDPNVNLRTVLSAFEDVQKYSVEAITSGSNAASVFDFSANECIYFASVNRYFTRQDEEEAGKREDLSETHLTHSRERSRLLLNQIPPELDVFGVEAENKGFWQGGGDNYNEASDFLDTVPGNLFANSIVTDCGAKTTNSASETIGVIYLYPAQFEGEVNLGLALAQPYRGQGFGKEAVRLLLKWAFDEAGYHRVQVMLIEGPGRDAALKLFTALGFVHEGTRRRQVLSPVSGEYKDVTYMAILDTEWLLRHYHDHSQNSLWDELFQRHQQEREELLKWSSGYAKLKRTHSMETVRIAGDDEPAPAKRLKGKQKEIPEGEDSANVEVADVLGEFLRETPPTGGWWSTSSSILPSTSISYGSASSSDRSEMESEDDASDGSRSARYSERGWSEPASPPPSEASSSSGWEIASEVSDASAGWDILEIGSVASHP